jgi:hypothetical protein
MKARALSWPYEDTVVPGAALIGAIVRGAAGHGEGVETGVSCVKLFTTVHLLVAGVRAVPTA